MNSITITALEAFPLQLEAHYFAIPAEFKHWAPTSWDGVPSEPLTAIEQICHVRDIEIEGYQVRFRRTLAEHNPTLAAIDTDAFVKQRSYSTSNGLEVLAAFRNARAQTVTLIKSLKPEQLTRAAAFDGYGSVSLQSLVHYLCSHDQQHLAGLQWLLGKLTAMRI